MNESDVIKKIRLITNLTGSLLYRNNSGALYDRDGRLIRYGLGNDSIILNKKYKSSDLIGITPIKIEPRHVGRVFAVFTAVEAKVERWTFRGGERETAQLNFINLIRERGGIATFAQSDLDYLNSIYEFVKWKD